MCTSLYDVVHLSEATDAELQIGAAQIGIKGYNEELLHPSKRNQLIKELQRRHYFNIVVNLHSRVISPYTIVEIDNCVLV